MISAPVGCNAVRTSTEHAFRSARLACETSSRGGGFPDGLGSGLTPDPHQMACSHIVELFWAFWYKRVLCY